MTERKFKKIIWDYYKKSGRHDLPWRKTHNPYNILVSEIMLQQTQVSRVLTKYKEFVAAFPTTKDLANTPLPKVLKIWQGLGYNRRAIYLKKTAELIIKDFEGIFPKTPEKLESLPGIGQSTRGAIVAFAYNIPTVFIETNIRSIYIHHFFPYKKKVADVEILPLIEKTLDQKNPRDWYYALMDYGVHLKQTIPNPSRKSKHHLKQSSFKGSNREVRSRILKYVLEKNRTEKEILNQIGKTKHNVSKNISDLVTEGFLIKDKSLFSIRE